MSDTLTITPCRPESVDAIISMWRAAFERGVGHPVPNSVQDHRAYFLDHVLPETTVQLAFQADRLVGFVAFTPESVMQLYVHVDHLGEGIGTRLLDLAKARSDGALWLYTFATNTRARRFYEHHGFEIEERGFEPLMQLEDIRYSWTRSTAC